MKNTVLITGGSQRIGAVISERIAQEGWNVIIHYNKSKNKAFNLKKKTNFLQNKLLLYKSRFIKRDRIKKIIYIRKKRNG